MIVKSHLFLVFFNKYFHIDFYSGKKQKDKKIGGDMLNKQCVNKNSLYITQYHVKWMYTMKIEGKKRQKYMNASPSWYLLRYPPYHEDVWLTHLNPVSKSWKWYPHQIRKNNFIKSDIDKHIQTFAYHMPSKTWMSSTRFFNLNNTKQCL